MLYNFDEIIDRNNTNSLSIDGYKEYLFGDKGEFCSKYSDEEMIFMWIADMEFGVAPEILDAVKARLDKRILGYTKVFSPKYFNSFKTWCQDMYDWTPNKEEWVTSLGIIPALYELVSFLCKPREKILLHTPAYGYFKRAADQNGIGLSCSPLINKDGEYLLDFDDFEERASDPDTTVFILCNPHNPTGRVWSEDELLRMGEICKKYGLWVLSDEIHCDLLRRGKEHIPFDKVFPGYEKTITCMSSSKTFNTAGLMFSNILIASPALRATYKRLHYDFENPLSIAAAKAAYEKGKPWLFALQNYLDENFNVLDTFLKQHLPKAVFKIPDATYLAWVDISPYLKEGEDVVRLFAEDAGVLIEGGDDLFVGNAAGFIRLNLAKPRVLLIEALNRISCTLKR